jgi:diguanylate cyclase (GGDEF)-like protein
MTAPLLDRSADGADRSAASSGRWPVPAQEADRLAALRSYSVLDQPAQPDLDAIARLAAYVCGRPYAAINLIDTDRQWQAAAFGVEPAEQDRADAPCAVVVAGATLVSVADASVDRRFAASPLVAGGRGIRAYASAPLLTAEGHAIGTVCAYDDEVGELSDVQQGLLTDLAAQVMSLFERRRLAAAISRITSRDALTGLANRRSLEMAISNAIARAERGLGTPSVVVLDVDDFAALAAAHGHRVGDAVLRSIAGRLVATARTVDTVARSGVAEFVVLLESTGGPGAVAALNRLRQSMVGGWDEVAEGFDVGVSLGITTYRPGDGVASLIARADAEMFADKARRSY